MWVYGYETDRIKGHVFPDVADCLHKWHKENQIFTYVYSSGVSEISKLLFSCSTSGNLLPVRGYGFDHVLRLFCSSSMDSTKLGRLA